jgi:EAL domain-containing protein (putative c-di-GMP-specific phosphodiesterase class I)
MDVVAEGVESAGQLDALRGMGCRFIQGWLVGRPMEAGELPSFLDGFDPAVLDSMIDAKMDMGVHMVGRGV